MEFDRVQTWAHCFFHTDIFDTLGWLLIIPIGVGDLLEEKIKIVKNRLLCFTIVVEPCRPNVEPVGKMCGEYFDL